MRIFRSGRGILSVLLAATLVACASAPSRAPAAAGTLPADGPVSVGWNDPAQFSEMRYSADHWESARGDWLQQLASHLRARIAPRLQPGQQLQLTIEDVDLAGGYEPWLGANYRHVRMMRDTYPPRITLSYELTDASGNRIAGDRHRLVDASYLMHSSRVNESDTLRHEKRLIDAWVAREFGERNAAR